MNENIDQTDRQKRGDGCLKGCGVAVLILLLIPVIWYGAYLLMRGPQPPQPQVIAHRGGRSQTPENTLAAFKHAISIGADWLELDVQRSRDGQLVVIHDDTVDRTTEGSGRVADLTLEQLRSLDAGQGEQIPTLTEVIQLAREARVGLFPEAKNAPLYPGLEDQIVGALREQGYLDHTILQSFDYDGLDEAVRANSDLQVCPLYGLWQFELHLPRPASARVLCPMGEMVLLNPWMIRQAHQDGRKIFAWFGAIENPLVMRVMLGLGVDGLIVDDPVALKNLVK